MSDIHYKHLYHTSSSSSSSYIRHTKNYHSHCFPSTFSICSIPSYYYYYFPSIHFSVPSFIFIILPCTRYLFNKFSNIKNLLQIHFGEYRKKGKRKKMEKNYIKKMRKTLLWMHAGSLGVCAFLLILNTFHVLKCCMWKHNSNIMFWDWRQPTNIKRNPTTRTRTTRRMMIKVICLKSIGNFILLPPPTSVCVCVFVLKYFLHNLDEDEACCWY